MWKLSLHPGVWSGSISLSLGGAIAVLGATSTQEPLIYCGWLSIAAGALLAIWGLKYNGDHWWQMLPSWWKNQVSWRFGRTLPTIETVQIQQKQSPSELPANRPSFKQEDDDEFPYPYAKAVLKLRIQNPRGTRKGDSSGKPFAMSIAAQLQNDHTKVLNNCSAVLRGISGITDGSRLIGQKFKLPANGTVQKTASIITQFAIVKRNMSDQITPEPFLFPIGEKSIPLDENQTYVFEIELQSEYKYSTLVRVQLDTGEDLDAEAQIIDHKIIEKTDG